MLLNCPNEPLVLKPGDKIPTDPAIEYVMVYNQNDYEMWNEAVRRAGAICRAKVHGNCQFYKDLNKHPDCVGTKSEEN